MKPSPLNLALCHRVMSTAWAMRRETLAAFTQAILSGTPPRPRVDPFVQTQRTRERSDTTWDVWQWNDDECKFQLARYPTKKGYTVANFEGLFASLRGTLPDVPDGTHVILVWGCLGRAWSMDERYWFDGIEVDEIMAAIRARPPGEKIVLWFRSPGGFVTGIPDTGAELRAMSAQRDIRAFTDDCCASAAYWLASQCREVIATPSADLGSIGVYLALYDYTAYLEKLGIRLELFRAGDLKGIGLVGNPLDEAAREYLQAGVAESYRLFTEAVTDMRDITPENMQGQTLNGASALAANLCDRQVNSATAFLSARP